MRNINKVILLIVVALGSQVKASGLSDEQMNQVLASMDAAIENVGGNPEIRRELLLPQPPRERIQRTCKTYWCTYYCFRYP